MAKLQRLSVKFFRQSGQAGLIVVLLAVVVLTIGLSLFVRTTRQADITSQQEEAARIFNAAETGVEKALSSILATEQDNVDFESIANQELLLDNDNAKVALALTQENKLETYLDEGSTAELELSSVDPVTVSWSKTTCAQGAAALIFSISNTDPGTSAKTTRYEAIKGTGCSNGHNFTESSTGSAPYQFAYTLTPVAGDTAVRIEPIFSGTDITASGLSVVKGQFVVTSKAQDNSGGSEQAKAIEVKRTLSTPPSFMDYTVYSGTSVSK